jgi:hypothetical protein
MNLFSYLFLSKYNKSGVVVHTCNSSYSRGRGRRILSLGHPWSKVRETLSQKQNTNKRTGGVSQMVECLLSMSKALGSIPCTK